ncbi:DUF5710 domain-containing protein [Dechloromonas sp. A34]|uniref:DUF5710 domain-containing protein n=1 Tax=Dechloromonas sp. A34 TaxID=447588 RepID=UPI00224879DC|nr:DUF5710 domain-containing protein [Dechloromonas sp. A34]
MRLDLKVPFAEKDAAKKLGARWDSARKIWYVVGQEDSAPFAKWSPTPHDESSPVPAPQNKAPALTRSAGKVYVGSDYVEHPRLCECLPWDVCDKCRTTALSAVAPVPCR